MNTNKATLTEKLSDIQIDSRPNADNLNICLCDDFIQIIRFAHEHQDCDPVRLLFQQQRYPDTDMRLVAQQLEGQRQSSAKWPTLAQCADIFYPPKLNREQSSSEATARYKAHIFSHLGGGTFADLTGGMGIDTLFLATAATHGDYVEQDENLGRIARHNFAAIGQHNLHCHQCDSMEWIGTQATARYDLLYIDPARRDSQGRKVSAFEDCTPNLLDNLASLLGRCRHLMVKASPMIDIDTALTQLKTAEEVHIVAVGGECKEVLFILSGNDTTASPVFHCLDLTAIPSPITFTRPEEAAVQPRFANSIGKYLYEPNAALMKGGCYNSVCQWYDMAKLARNTHLYTTDQWVADFPGRKFEVIQELTLNAKAIAKILPEHKAHVATRNYPMAAAELQKKLKLHEGGAHFIIAATLASRPIGLLCRQRY